jgi:hypothetical protein
MGQTSACYLTLREEAWLTLSLSRGKHQERLFTALSGKFGISYQDKAKCGGPRMAGAKQWMSLPVCALQSLWGRNSNSVPLARNRS